MTTPTRLFRSNALDVMERFLNEGEIRFRPLIYYRTVENKIIADEYEGSVTSNLTNAKLQIQDPLTDKWSDPLDIVFGRLTFSINETNDLHLSSYSIKQQSHFGEATVEIFDVAGFLQRIDQGFRQHGFILNYGLVRYYNEVSPLTKPSAGEMWLYKRDAYSREGEFRLGVTLNRALLYKSTFQAKYSDPNIKAPDFITFRFGSFVNFAKMV